MRDVNRIEPFMNELVNIWKEQCPDWRFFQLISNIQYYYGNDLFYIEENKAIEIIKNYFNIKDEKQGEI